MLDYEKLDVYRCSIEHLAFVFRSLTLVPRGYSSLVVRLLNVIPEPDLMGAKALVTRVVEMLSKLCR